MTLNSAMKLVGVIFGCLRLSQVKTLAWAALGCVRKPRGLLSEIARGSDGETDLKHKVKRLGRWLSNRRVHMEELAPSLLQWLIARQGELFRPLLAIDWTKEHGYAILTLSFLCHGRAVPFYWYCVREGKLRHSQNQIESMAIGLLKMWMGGRPFVLVGDRGFHRSALIRALVEKYRIDFVIRVVRTTHVRVRGYAGPLEGLAVRVGQVRDFREAEYGGNARVRVRLVVKRIKAQRGQDVEESIWYLVTSLRQESKWLVVEYYRQRMGAECGHRDWKTALGFRMQKRIVGEERLSRYLLILTTAMLLALYVANRRVAQWFRNRVAFSRSWGTIHSVSVLTLGILVLQCSSNRLTSIHHKILFHIGRL